MDTMQRISKAKTALLLDHPFVGSLALKLNTVVADNIQGHPVPTAATDGKTICYNPAFVAGLSDSQLVFLVAHEVFHPMFEHHIRRGNRDGTRWNVAADYVINQLLVDEGIGAMPKGGLLDRDIYAKGGGTAEGIYAILPASKRKALDEVLESDGDPAEEAARIRAEVVQAAQASRMAGKLSAGIERIISDLINPVVPWQTLLARFLHRTKTTERTFARPNRRFLPQGMYLPSISGEAMGELVVAIDCSGSIDTALLNAFAAEINSIKQDLNPSVLHLVYFDASVCHVDSVEQGDPINITMRGGGGTAFSPVFDWVADNDINPVACVFLTDLYGFDFGNEPEYPVLWVSNGSLDAPFGEVIHAQL